MMCFDVTFTDIAASHTNSYRPRGRKARLMTPSSKAAEVSVHKHVGVSTDARFLVKSVKSRRDLALRVLLCSITTGLGYTVY